MSQAKCGALERVRREDPEKFDGFLADESFDFNGHLTSCRDCANFFRSSLSVERALPRVYSEAPQGLSESRVDVRKNTARILERAFGADERPADGWTFAAFLDLLFGTPARKFSFAAMPAVLLLALAAFHLLRSGKVETPADGSATTVAVGEARPPEKKGASAAPDAVEREDVIPFECGTYALSADAKIVSGQGMIRVDGGTVSFNFRKSRELSAEGFSIHTPHLRIAITGTALEVRVSGDSTSVAVAEGRVEVTEAPGGKPFSATVSGGERLVADRETATCVRGGKAVDLIGRAKALSADTVEAMIRSGEAKTAETMVAPTSPAAPTTPVAPAAPADPAAPASPFTSGDGMK